VVLDLIRAARVISRVELAATTGLTAPTISEVVRELIADGLVLEAGRGASTGGKPPLLVQLNRTPVELCGPDFTAHFPGLPPMNVEAYDEFAAAFHAPFSDLRHPIDEVVVDADRVAVRLRFEGAHTGGFMGVPASGRRFSVEGTAFLHVADGKVTEFWGFLDRMGLMQQIGGLPAPPQG